MLNIMGSGLIIPSTEVFVITIVRTAIIFVYTFILLRFLGKKQASQFTWFDFLLIIALGSAVGDTMIYPERTIPVFISMTAIFMVVFMVRLFTDLMLRSETVETLIEGTEELLVNRGRVLPDALNRSELTERELHTLLREKGYLSLKGIDKVILETNGEISVIHSSRPH